MPKIVWTGSTADADVAGAFGRRFTAKRGEPIEVDEADAAVICEGNRRWQLVEEEKPAARRPAKKDEAE